MEEQHRSNENDIFFLLPLSERHKDWFSQKRKRTSGRYDTYYCNLWSNSVFRSRVEVVKYIFFDTSPEKNKKKETTKSKSTKKSEDTPPPGFEVPRYAPSKKRTSSKKNLCIPSESYDEEMPQTPAEFLAVAYRNLQNCSNKRRNRGFDHNTSGYPKVDAKEVPSYSCEDKHHIHVVREFFATTYGNLLSYDHDENKMDESFSENDDPKECGKEKSHGYYDEEIEEKEEVLNVVKEVLDTTHNEKTDQGFEIISEPVMDIMFPCVDQSKEETPDMEEKIEVVEEQNEQKESKSHDHCDEEKAKKEVLKIDEEVLDIEDNEKIDHGFEIIDEALMFPIFDENKEETPKLEEKIEVVEELGDAAKIAKVDDDQFFYGIDELEMDILLKKEKTPEMVEEPRDGAKIDDHVFYGIDELEIDIMLEKAKKPEAVEEFPKGADTNKANQSVEKNSEPEADIRPKNEFNNFEKFLDVAHDSLFQLHDFFNGQLEIPQGLSIEMAVEELQGGGACFSQSTIDNGYVLDQFGDNLFSNESISKDFESMFQTL
ncbi:uncharacterized protein LOC131160106 isoform X2 [Malania oleifera]|nr:uncharacterized protein LOC131160106 isoform X2 [Malania oleifera]XP_057971432.1 uncharacterized protein LOC131160106 isoform X2 [Malania oleifera]